MLDLSNRLVGIHIGSWSGGDPAIAMQLTTGYKTFVGYYLSQFHSELVIGDFDGDGARDFFHHNENNRGNWVDMNDGGWPDGGGEPGLGFTWCAPDLHVGDFNGDGRDDLLCHGAPGDSLYPRLGAAAGGFGASTTLPSSWCGHELFVGDFDGDGWDDLLCREQGSQTERAPGPSARRRAWLRPGAASSSSWPTQRRRA